MRAAAIGLLVAALCLAAGTRAQAPVPISDEARQLFAVGVTLLEDPNGPRYEEAHEAFRRAYAASPTPKILSNLGLCAMMLERDGEAIDAYQHYLADVPDVPPAERQKIAKDLETLRARNATLVVDSAAGTVVDERVPSSGPAVVNRYPTPGHLELIVRAGDHRVRLETAAGQSEAVRADIAAGERRAVAIETAKPPPPPSVPPPVLPPSPPSPPALSPEPPSRGSGLLVGGIAGLGIGGALAIAGAVTGGLALKAQSDYEGFQSGGDREDAESVRSEGEALNITTDVLFGGAVLSGAIGTILLVVHATSAGGEGASRAAVSASRPGTLELRF